MNNSYTEKNKKPNYIPDLNTDGKSKPCDARCGNNNHRIGCLNASDLTQKYIHRCKKCRHEADLNISLNNFVCIECDSEEYISIPEKPPITNDKLATLPSSAISQELRKRIIEILEERDAHMGGTSSEVIVDQIITIIADCVDVQLK